jgi:anti-anti-sigma factor
MTGDVRWVGVDAGTALTAATAAEVRAVVTDALQGGRTIDLYLDSVMSYDAAGLGLLLGLKRRIEAADGHLVCVNPSPRLYYGIRKLGLHRVLDIRLDLPDPRPAMEQRPLPTVRKGQPT